MYSDIVKRDENYKRGKCNEMSAVPALYIA